MEKVRAQDSSSKYVAKYSYFTCFGLSHMTAGGLGIEPKLMASKATVLPLDDPPKNFLVFCPEENRGTETNVVTEYPKN